MAAAVAVAALLLGLTAWGAARTTGPSRAAAAVEPAPTTTMSPVQPVAEEVVPFPAGSRVASSWVAEVSQRTGIGPVAVRAYGEAALRLAEEQPRCKLGWTTLAGIGGIESGHGTNGGAFLEPDGRASRPILGPALDGTAGTAAIPADKESVDRHGDQSWDHAVGPLQFIGSTWRQWGSDGDGDQMTDPHDIDDAAYTAGRYLCASGADLTTGAGWTRAVFSYNHSDAYVRSVLARANRYAAG